MLQPLHVLVHVDIGGVEIISLTAPALVEFGQLCGSGGGQGIHLGGDGIQVIGRILNLQAVPKLPLMFDSL